MAISYKHQALRSSHKKLGRKNGKTAISNQCRSWLRPKSKIDVETSQKNCAAVYSNKREKETSRPQKKLVQAWTGHESRYRSGHRPSKTKSQNRQIKILRISRRQNKSLSRMHGVEPQQVSEIGKVTLRPSKEIKSAAIYVV